MWERDPWYVPGRDPAAYVMAAHKGEKVRNVEKLTYDVKRNIDIEYKRLAFRFVEENARAKRPFCLYFNYSLMHYPVVPRDDYKGKSANGDWADCLLQLEGDFGEMLDRLDALGLRESTIVVFAGDNGNEDFLLARGTGGYWAGSYFTGMEASSRTPCLVRWPGEVPAGSRSNEIVHIADMFTTLLTMAGLKVPADRVIDGVDQSPFFRGRQKESNREGFMYWNGDRLYGVK
jgi:arylsulfatase